MTWLAGVRWPALFLGLGLGAAHHQMLGSGFQRMESDLYDGRFFNYVLEHAWRWLIGAPHHGSLWSPAFYYPAENAGAYSEILLGAAFPYFAARAAGLEMDSAYQAWLLALGGLNFVSTFVLARWAFGASRLGASVAGALFAFAGPRLAEATWGHYQVFPQFWTVFALLAFSIAAAEGRWWRRSTAAFLVGPCLALQLWSGFYIGWFAGLALLVVLPLVLLVPALRVAAWGLRRLAGPLAAGGFAAALLIVPLARPYLAAAESEGVRAFDETLLPTPATWLAPGAASIVYGPLAELPVFAESTLPGQPLGFGLLTTALATAGLVLGRRRRGLSLLACAAVALIALSTRLEVGTLWRVVYDLVPGAPAIRAVSRVSMLVTLPVALGVAVALDRIRGALARPRLAACGAAGLGLLCLAEQTKHQGWFGKAWNRAVVSEIARRVAPARCDAFFYSAVEPIFRPPKYSIDAMWAALESGVPTVNGYTGFLPDGWLLSSCTVHTAADDERLRADLARWVERSRLEAARVCPVRLRSRVRAQRAAD